MVCADNLVVEFPVYEADTRSFKNTMLRIATGGVLVRDASRHMAIRALDHISFEMKEGDRVGLVGHNGSGKSTLLRVIAGVYEPVSGSINVTGRVAAMLNVWLGMNSDATGFENIYLRATVLGMRPQEIDRLVGDVCEFAELGDYIYMPLRTYSSGMQMRLAFAISTSVAADIILMDEWLSAGDAAFQKKAQARLNQMIGQAKILVVASHNEAQIRANCNRILRLEHGAITELTSI
ncbi:MAG: ABC transporter ATP-binding protein [Gammaproteobacteria bacterium]